MLRNKGQFYFKLAMFPLIQLDWDCPQHVKPYETA